MAKNGIFENSRTLSRSKSRKLTVLTSFFDLPKSGSFRQLGILTNWLYPKEAWWTGPGPCYAAPTYMWPGGCGGWYPGYGCGGGRSIGSGPPWYGSGSGFWTTTETRFREARRAGFPLFYGQMGPKSGQIFTKKRPLFDHFFDHFSTTSWNPKKSKISTFSWNMSKMSKISTFSWNLSKILVQNPKPNPMGLAFLVKTGQNRSKRSISAFLVKTVNFGILHRDSEGILDTFGQFWHISAILTHFLPMSRTAGQKD